MKRLILCAVVVVFGVGQLEAAIITADVAVDSPGGQFAPLEVGEFINVIDHRYFWYEVPTFAEEQNFLFWQVLLSGGSADGITTFEVLSDGPVLMAVTTRWGGGGNPDGDWMPELTTREELEQQGWVEFATGLSDTRDGLPGPGHEYIVFRRDSVAGEIFTYRTEKYRAPMIIRSEVTAIPEPSTLIIWSLLGAGGLLAYAPRRRR